MKWGGGMKAVILSCSALDGSVSAAQKKMKTNYPVVNVDRKYHEDPKQMRKQLVEKLGGLPSETDTVLVAMGFCGGSWKEIAIQKRVVIPRVDDCITLLLHTDDNWYPNLKKAGHLYLSDTDTGEHSLEAMLEKMCERCGREDGESIFRSMFASYTNADIMDTGLYDCYAKEYIAEAQKKADLIGCALGYVDGSNLLLEKLVSGRWDRQFIVAEPGQMLAENDFLEN